MFVKSQVYHRVQFKLAEVLVLYIEERLLAEVEELFLSLHGPLCKRKQDIDTTVKDFEIHIIHKDLFTTVEKPIRGNTETAGLKMSRPVPIYRETKFTHEWGSPSS